MRATPSSDWRARQVPTIVPATTHATTLMMNVVMRTAS
jgi:hypothetical protein